MQSLSERTAGFTDSVIRRMTRVSMQYDAVNLSQGFPDFEPPKELLDRLAQVAYEDYHQYSITWGSQNFREALAAKQTYFMGRRIDPNTEIVTTCGSTEAMMAAMMTVTNPGDKVIIFSPFYENYGADTILSGAEPIYVPLVPPDFHFDANVLEDAFRQHPKAIILCNPSNPCGKVFTREELEIIASLAEKYDTYVITDEVYEHIVFAPNKHTYFATLPGMWERTLSCSSLSKTYSVTGWRLGYIIAPPEIIDRAKKVHDFLTVGAAAPLAGGCCYRSEDGSGLLRRSAGQVHAQKGSVPERSGRSQNRPYRPAGRVLCSARYCRVRLRERSCVLRGSGALCRRRRGSRTRASSVSRSTT